MIGRDRELGELTGQLSSTEYRGVVLVGKPGVGKSRLAREVVSAAQAAGWTVRKAAATATSQLIPLGAFTQWTDDLRGEPIEWARRVAQALTTGVQPQRVLVFVDDAHLLDALSALVVHQIVQSQAAPVIVTIRAGESAPAAITALWKDGLLCRREVEPLARNEINALMAAVLGGTPDQHCGDKLWRLTRGNVLFLRQLVEQESQAGRLVSHDGAVRWCGDAAISGSLAEVVDAQIGAVPGGVRDVVDLVAVAEPLDWKCLRLLADTAAIEQAEQRELIRTVGDDVYIGHPMYAEIRVNRCGPTRLRRLRGQIATAMKDGGGPAAAMKRGILWLDSDLSPEPDVLLSAATAATSLLDFEMAERLYTAAASTGMAAQARIPLAYTLFMTQRGELALEVLDGADSDADGKAGFVNEVIMRAANLLWAKRSIEQSWRVIDQALDEVGPGARRQQLLVFRANQLALAARPVEVLETLTDVDYGELDYYGATMGLSAACMAYGEIGRADQAVQSAIASGRALTLSEHGEYLRQPLAEFHTFALAAAGRIAEAVEVAERHRRSQRSDPVPAQAVASQILGMTMLAAGDLAAALRLLPEALDDSEVANNFHAANSFHRFHLLRAQALALSGDVDAAQRALETARAQRHPAYEFVRSTEVLTEAWLAACRARLSEARRLARAAAALAREHSQFAREVWCLQTAVQFDDVDAGARLAELATIVDGPRAAVAARYARAVSADDAVELDQVSAQFEAMGDRLAAADAAAQAAASHRRARRTGSAITSAARAGRLVADTGGATTPAIAAASFPLPFSQREHEIALLVAQGLSNRDIAVAVSLSVRTVEGHIYSACNKVGAKGRADLAELVHSVGR